MTSSALVLAAHGSRHEPIVNEQIRALAKTIRNQCPIDEVAVAFHQGAPAFCEVLDDLAAAEIIVVPVMTSQGYYTNTVLPHELKSNETFARKNVRITPPIGLHPKMPDLIAARVDALTEEFDIDPGATAVTLIGHGTPKHAQSRRATEEIASQLTNRNRWAHVFAAFLDEDPPVESVCSLAPSPTIVVIPFLIGAGPHALSDIPRRLGISTAGKTELPCTGHFENRFVVCDAPIGSDPAIADFILDFATTALSYAKEHSL